MANAQKRGFRFPWGGDDQPATPADGDPTPDPGFAERLDALRDDLGTGPFDLRPQDEDGTETMHAAEPAGEDTSVADMAAPASTDEATGPDTPTAGSAAAGGSGRSWPEHDRRAAGRPFATPGATPASGTGAGAAAGSASAAQAGSQPGAPRRVVNPLVAGLVKAMREAARTARDESVATLRGEAAAREESIRADSTVNAGELRKVADADVAGIREWSKAELTRVREETEQRIAARRDQLVAETEAEARATEATLQHLADAVAAFETETDAFFEALLAEEDPARLAGLAERLPQPPSLEAFTASGEVPADPAADAELARAAEATQGRDDADVAPLDGETTETVDDGSGPDRLGPEDAAAAEAASMAGLDGQTQLLVSGLSGMAAIAAFKSGLLRLPGISAVSVMATAGGELAFMVTHEADADLRDGLRSMTGFSARVLADDGTSVTVAATAVAA